MSSMIKSRVIHENRSKSESELELELESEYHGVDGSEDERARYDVGRRGQKGRSEDGGNAADEEG